MVSATALLAWLRAREGAAGLVVGAVYAGLAARIERGEFDEEEEGS